MLLLRAGSFLVLSLVLVSIGCGQTSGPAATEVGGGGDFGPVLQTLHDRDATLSDFTAVIKKQDYKPRTAETETRTGTVTYLKEGGVTKIAIHFDQYFPPELPPQKLNHDLIFDGQFGVNREDNPGAHSKIFRRQALVAPADVGKVNPLKLGEGLFAADLPLPIGQDPAEITKNFAVTVVPLDPLADGKLAALSGKAGDLVHLRLVPRVKEQFSFKQLDLFIDLSPGMQLPLRIVIHNRDGNVSTIDLTEIRTNRGGIDSGKVFDVTTPGPNSGWTVTEEPYKK